MLTCGTSGAPNSTEALSGACRISPSVLNVLLVSGIAICADRGTASRKRNARTQHLPWFNIGEATPQVSGRPPSQGRIGIQEFYSPLFSCQPQFRFCPTLQLKRFARRT